LPIAYHLFSMISSRTISDIQNKNSGLVYLEKEEFSYDDRVCICYSLNIYDFLSKTK